MGGWGGAKISKIWKVEQKHPHSRVLDCGARKKGNFVRSPTPGTDGKRKKKKNSVPPVKGGEAEFT